MLNKINTAMSKKTTIVNRIMKEITEMKHSPPENCSAGPENDSNIMLWKATIIGPKASPFENGIFILTIEFPPNYPFVAPNIKFNTPVYHPNINKTSGAICLDILKSEWSPALTISKVLLSICSLLTDPNPNDPFEPGIAREYIKNKNKYEMTARSWTNKFAGGFGSVDDVKIEVTSDDDDDDDDDDAFNNGDDDEEEESVE